jgi:hypothetical protein
MVWSFTTGSSPAAAPPSSVNPGNDASAVALNQILSATFLAAMNGTTFTTSTFTVTGPGGLVAGTVAYDGTNRIARFTPASNYAPNTTFTARLTTGVRDANGYALASAHVWSFTTGAVVDGSLAVSSTNPADGASGVPTNQTVAATFRTAMDSSTLTTATFTLNLSGGAAVSGNVAYDAVNRVVTFTPAALLAASTTFVARLSTAVRDGSGHPFANSYAWNFSTGDAPAADPPSSVNPGNDASAVALNQIVSATFLAAMDGTTLTTETFTVTGPGGLVAGTVAYDAPNGIVRFTPASTYAPNTTFTARLTTAVRNAAGHALAAAHVWSFTTGSAVDGSLAVSSTNPADGASGVPTNQTVAASFRTAMDGSTLTTATFTVTISGGAAVSGTVDYDATTRVVTFTPAALLPASTTFEARLSTAVRDGSANPFANPYSWNFSTGTAPAAAPPSSVNPGNDASAVALNQIVSATFPAAMDGSTILFTTFTVTGPGGQVAGSVAYDVANRIARFTPASNYAANTLFTARLTTAVKNAAGYALATAHVWRFTTGSVVDGSLAVSSTNPADGAVDVPTNQKVTVSFRTAMDGSTLTTSSFTLTVSGGAAVAGSVVYDAVNRVVTFTPANLLVVQTNYVARLSTAVKDASGHPFANPMSWGFRTGGTIDGTAPFVTTSSPSPNATGVTTPLTVTASFSEAMNSSTITSATFTVAGPGSSVVTGTVTYDALSNTARFAPNATLAGGSVYTPTITLGAEDLAGNPMDAPFVWQFTTLTTIDGSLAVSSTNPTDGATGVPTNQTVSAVFAAPMDSSTLTTATFTVSAGGGANVTGTVVYNAGTRTVSFSPTGFFPVGTTLLARLSTTVANAAGEPFAAPYVWGFTTGDQPLFATRPTSVSPSDGVTGVLTNRVVSATFPTAMDSSTFTTSTFLVTGLGGAQVAGTVSYDEPNRIARFAPASNYTTSTTLTATLTTAVRNQAGYPLQNAEVWSFTTGLLAGLGPIAVISTDPTDGATGVPTNQLVAATFRSAMDASTLTTSTFTLSDGGSPPVTGTIFYDAANRVATFTSQDLLLADNTFIARFSTDVKASDGSPFLEPYVWGFSTGSTSDTTPPTVASKLPADGTTGVALNQSINATFSEAMDPTSITSVTFTLSGPGAVAVTGVVTYDAPGRIGTFNPSDLLSPSSTYTPTVTIGATDLAGNPMASSAVWTFSTSATASTSIQEFVALGAAGSFAILAGSTVTNTGPTILNGDLGVSPGTAVTGFPPGSVNGSIHAGDSDAALAKLALTTAYNDAAGRSTAPITVAGNLGGMTLAPGLYKSGESLEISSGDLTLDAKGDANGAFVFQMGSTLTTTVGRKIILSGGAKATNVYWQVGSSATLGVSSIFKGNILADQSITLETGATMEGRALTRIGAVTLDSNTVTVPTP